MHGSPFSALRGLFSPSDEEAMLRVQRSGDPRAFALLVRRWERPLRRLCVGMTGDWHRGEDLTQEAFTRLFVHRQQFKGSARLSTFLWRIALNLCLDDQKRLKLRTESAMHCAGSECPATVEQPDAPVLAQERADLVQAALVRLPAPQRAVVVLRHYEGLKFREIAEVLDIPTGTVRSRMAKALTRLARFLKPTLGGTRTSNANGEATNANGKDET